MKHCRIIKREHCGTTSYVIQQKHLLFRWWWVDASLNSSAFAYTTDSFDTLKEAQANLCLFNGTKTKETLISTHGPDPI